MNGLLPISEMDQDLTEKEKRQTFNFIAASSSFSLLGNNCRFHGKSGWPRHKENGEFGYQFFQTGETQGI